MCAGEFNHDVIHGEGVWHWTDGSMYAGQAKHGNREGRGLYITAMRVSLVGGLVHTTGVWKSQGVVRHCMHHSLQEDEDALT